jgi:hypothetical protein
MFGYIKYNKMTYNDCKAEIAAKYGLGKTLVTGHRAVFFQEAAEMYANWKVSQHKLRHKVTVNETPKCHWYKHEVDIHDYGNCRVCGGGFKKCN